MSNVGQDQAQNGASQTTSMVDRQEFEAFLENRGVRKGTPQYDQAMQFFIAASQGKFKEFAQNQTQARPLDASKAYDFSHLAGTTYPSFKFDDMRLLRDAGVSETEYLTYLKYYKVPGKSEQFEAAVSWFNFARGGVSGKVLSKALYQKCPPSDQLLAYFKPKQASVAKETKPAPEIELPQVKQDPIRREEVVELPEPRKQNITSSYPVTSFQNGLNSGQLPADKTSVLGSPGVYSVTGKSTNSAPKVLGLSFSGKLLEELKPEQVMPSNIKEMQEQIVLASLVLESSNANLYSPFMDSEKAREYSRQIESLVGGLASKRDADIPQIAGWLKKRGLNAQNFLVNNEFNWAKAIRAFVSSTGLLGQQEVLSMVQYASSLVDVKPFNSGLNRLLERIVVDGPVGPAVVIFCLGDCTQALVRYVYKDEVSFGVERSLELDFWAENKPLVREKLVLDALERGKISLQKASLMMAFTTWATCGYVMHPAGVSVH